MPPITACSGAKRTWVRLQFYDYPLIDGTQWYGASSAGKTKVYCIKCFDTGFDKLKSQEHSEVATGIRQQARTDEELKLYRM